MPSDPLRASRPDPHYAGGAAAARELGHTVALVDHDALCRPGAESNALSRVRGEGEAVYRGWMLRAERYAAFEGALAQRGIRLRTTASAYKSAHELPGWYEALRAYTPETVWTAGPGEDAFEECRRSLRAGPAVLRDYTKSMKHHWDEAAYIPDLADRAGAWRVAKRFLELREDDFTGGFVLRRFERFTSAEARTWWRDGECVLVTPHPDTPAESVPETVAAQAFAPAIAALGLPFVTVDLVLRDDGQWRVVELGDGQVSDRPASTDTYNFINILG